MSQSFEAFLAEWRKQNLPTVLNRELDEVLEQRARELSELAMQRGFRSKLTKACQPYRTMTEFVRALYDTSNHQRKQTDES